jgi:hypothetical protein
MSDNNDTRDDINDDDDDQNTGQSTSKLDLSDPELTALLEERIRQSLKPMKENMNSMAKQRDEALKKLAAIEAQQKEAEIASLKEQGKHEEAYQKQLIELQAKLEAAQEANTRLTRDQSLKDALTALEGKKFRNQRSFDLAFKEIVGQLVRDEDGNWKHRTGISIAEFVKTFANNEEYDFLFLPPENKGTGTSANSGVIRRDPNKKLSQMDTNEVLRLAAEGKLGKRSL